MPTRTLLLDDRALGRTLVRMATEIVERSGGTDDLVLIGIQRRGVSSPTVSSVSSITPKAPRPCGKLDITLYRDDLQTVGPAGGRGDPSAQSRGRTVVIVDDVLLYGANGPSGARRVRRLRPAPADPAVRAHRPRRTGAADPGRHRGHVGQHDSRRPRGRVRERARWPGRGRAGVGWLR